MTTPQPLLSVTNLFVSYGSARALFDVSLEVSPGSIFALLGPNGAGKSTFARALTGLVPVQEGKCRFGGEDITNRPAFQIRRAGLVHVPEGRGIFPGLSVDDNLQMAVRRAGSSREKAAALDRALSVFPALGSKRHQRAGSMSGGEQQMLALARALAVNPRLIVADEMSLGLAPRIVEEVFQALEDARQQGVTIVLIEQFVHRALSFSDRCAILVQGRIAWSGPAKSAGDDILSSYLGHNEIEA